MAFFLSSLHRLHGLRGQKDRPLLDRRQAEKDMTTTEGKTGQPLRVQRPARSKRGSEGKVQLRNGAPGIVFTHHSRQVQMHLVKR